MTNSSHRGKVPGSLLLLMTASVLTGCSTVQQQPSPTKPQTVQRGERTVAASRILPLASPADAFVARLLCAAKATKTLDLQYYIWHGDETGRLLAGAVYEAAGRGVKCRILIDDMGTAAKDTTLLALDQHPNIEVRLFNPIRLRSARLLGTLLDFRRVNRRMHNKTFTADGLVAIVGGRNIGDEYFGAAEDMNFADFDVAAAGPVVQEVQKSFADYWASPSTKPVTEVTKKRATEDDVRRVVEELRAHRRTMEGSSYAEALRASPLRNKPLRDLPLFHAGATIVCDDPLKASTRPEDASTHLAPQMQAVMDRVRKKLVLVSPYFIPGREGVRWFADLRRRGLDISIITNSLASTDVAAVHAGYTRYRRELLDLGVRLYELKPASDPGKTSPTKGISLTGSSQAGLHAKTFVFDQRWVFVGSMNLDPRSLRLNTEVGMIIDSPALAGEMMKRIGPRLADHSWQVTSTPQGLTWTTSENGHPLSRTSEPPAGFWKKLMWRISSCLPIESQL